MDAVPFPTAKDISDALRGTPSGEGYTCPCPAHHDKTPSLSVKEGKNGRPIFHCHAGCKQEEVIEALQQQGLWPLREKAEPTKQKASLNTEWARDKWDKARELDRRKPHPYFLGRGIDTTAFRFLSAVRILAVDAHRASGTTGPSIVAMVTNNDGAIRAVQRTFLSADESQKRGVAPARQSLGPIKGHAIRIGLNTPTMMIAEGLEDAMTAHAAMGFTHCAWAAVGLGASAIALPDEITDVIVLSDRDPHGAGQRGAAEAAVRFKAAGKRVRVAIPPDGVKDFNALVQGKEEAERIAGYALVKACIEAAAEPDLSSVEVGGKIGDYLVDTRGRKLAGMANVLTLLRTEPGFGAALRYNELLVSPILGEALPRHDGLKFKDKFPRRVNDTDTTDVMEYAQQKGILEHRLNIIRAAIVKIAKENSFHPFREYLEGLQWDGVPRLGKFFPRYFGAARTPYTILAGVYFITSIVARAYRPGCKVDYMVILEGGQGLLKSQACRLLVSDEFFAENLPNILRKDALEQLPGNVLIELPEVVNLLRDDMEGFKAFLTRRVDRFRPSYGHFAENYPRVPVFIGTTNLNEYLDDPTGGRRFWPVVTGVIDLLGLKTDRNQIFAEAVFRYKKARRWWPTRLVEAHCFSGEQEARQQSDDREEVMARWIVREAPTVEVLNRVKNKPRVMLDASVRTRWDAQIPRGFTIGEIWTKALGMRSDVPFNPTLQKQVVKCLRRLGCTRADRKQQGRRYWLPPEKADWLEKDAGPLYGG
jgi:hypothetical protein